MARPAVTDFLQNFRFIVSTYGGAGPEGTSDGDWFGKPPSSATSPSGVEVIGPGDQGASGGFSTCTTPQGTIDAVEYREGHYSYTRKQPGIPTFDDVSLTRGVLLKDTQLYEWWLVVAEGSGGYRSDISIKHFHRGPKPTAHPAINPAADRAYDFADNTLVRDPNGMNIASPMWKEYLLFNAFPTSHKVSGDLDATGTDISLSELTIGYEYFRIRTNSEIDPNRAFTDAQTR